MVFIVVIKFALWTLILNVISLGNHLSLKLCYMSSHTSHYNMEYKHNLVKKNINIGMTL